MRKSKRQVNFRFPDTLIRELKERADNEGVSITDLVVSFLESSLGLPHKKSNRLSFPVEVEASTVDLDERIATQVTLQLANLNERIENVERVVNQFVESLQEVEQRLDGLQVELLPKLMSVQQQVDVLLLPTTSKDVTVQPQPEAQPEVLAEIQTPISDAVPSRLKTLKFAKGLTQNELAKRLGKYATTVSRHRHKESFPNWSRELDPEQIAWRFDSKKQRYYLADR